MLLSSALGHGAQEGPSGLYEGLNVATVDLVADPAINPEVFRPLVVQKAGTTYSGLEIQKTVTALQNTGKFAKVDVQVRTAASGLRVTFVLEPVFYVGMIYFPGATKEFDYPRLLELVNYPVQDPYQATRAEQRKPALIHFFAQRGYFQAKVKVETRLDRAQKVADINYNVTLGPHAKFGEIEITGAPPAETAQIQAALHSFRARLHGATVKEGKPFRAERLQAADKFLQDFLGKQNHLANQVRLDQPKYDAQTNRAALHWQVTMGPTVQIRVEGARISKRALKARVPFYEENSFDADLVAEGQRNLVSYFQGKGYFDAKVTPQTRREQSQISLVYQVDRGARHRVTRVRITGNQHFDERQLSSQVVVQKSRFFLFSHGAFNNDMLTRSVNNLTAYYHNAGYQVVKVQPEVSDKTENLEVTFRIIEGELSRVAAFNLEGNKTQPLTALAPKGMNLKPGQPYSQSRSDADRSKIIARYLELGYPTATVRWAVKPVDGDPHHVAVTFLIEEGPEVHIANVNYLGQAHTNSSFLERNTSVKPADPLSEDKILASESALYNLGVFDWASVDPRQPITDQQTDDVLVRVHEAKRNSLTWGMGAQYTPVGGSLSSGIVALPGLPTLGIPKNFTVLEKNIFSPLGSIDYTRLNILGRAETATVGAFVSVLDQRASFNYTDPQFHGVHWSSLLTLSAERTAQNPLFEARLGTASFQLEKTLDKSKTKRLQFRYTFQRTSLTNLLIQNFIPPEDESVHSSMVSGTFIRDTRDKPLDAHRGFFQSLDLGISPKAFGSTDNFARFFGQTAYYRQMTPWMVWANEVRIGLVDSFAGSHVPISERFFSGGADSLRGYALNEAGPQVVATLCTKANVPATCTATISAPAGGHQLFIFNSEGRFPLTVIYKNLGGALFYDGGNVYSNIGFGHFFRDYSNTVGFGLRYNTPVGPIRIDVGRNLNPVPGLKRTNLFITLGQAF